MSLLGRRLFIALLLLAAAPTQLAAAQQSYRMRYDISLYGLPIGRALLESRFEGRGFAIAGNFASAGIARIFDSTDGTMAVSGRVGESVSQPSHYTLDYKSGKRQRKIAIRFDGGNVTEADTRPAPKGGKDWIPVAEEHLSGVSDPISALLLPASDEADLCRRTVRVFDGVTRADLVFEPVSGSEGFSRAAITCRARFVPVSGYRKGHSSIAYLRDRARIMVGFGPLDGQGLYSPVEATIATKIGTVHIRARPM